MSRYRFSLRRLIVLVTATSLFLGFSQFRRQSILKVCAELKEDGYTFAVPQTWHDYIWQRKPTVAIVIETPQGDFLAQETNWTTGHRLEFRDEPNEIERLKALGMVEYR